ncbi:MAG: CheW domain protein [Gemmatimonadetes bacterium]|nr:CheW domain protein [Gemmatimonadota bacterium]
MVVKAAGAESYVLCELAGTTYALRSDDIEQLEMVGQLTPVPNAPPFVDGVTSVRGRVIPAISLRARFGFDRVEHTLRTRLVVVRSEGRVVGLIVDNAREFAAIPTDAIHPPPEGMADLSTRYLRGTAHLGERLIFVLDVTELLRVTESSATPLPPLLPSLG